jgi:hypothetical protein
MVHQSMSLSRLSVTNEIEPVADVVTCAHAIAEASHINGLGQKTASFPRTTDLIDAWWQAVDGTRTNFSKYVTKFSTNLLKSRPGRWRDILPLPRVASTDLSWPMEVDIPSFVPFMRVLHSFGWFELARRFSAHSPVLVSARVHHKNVTNRMLTDIFVFFTALESLRKTPAIDGVFLRAAGCNGAERYLQLRADVFLVESCAQVDPFKFMDAGIERRS